MPTSSEIRVSIDVGCHSHSVAIGLPTGEVLDEFDLRHQPEGFDLFFERVEICQRRYGGEVSVAMEGYNGWARPLDTLVRSRGYRLFNINNLKLARFKEIFPAAAKSDRAIHVNIEIMRAFVRLRQMLASNVELTRKLAALERKYDSQFKIVFDAIRELMMPPAPKKSGPSASRHGKTNEERLRITACHARGQTR